MKTNNTTTVLDRWNRPVNTHSAISPSTRHKACLLGVVDREVWCIRCETDQVATGTGGYHTVNLCSVNEEPS